MVNLYKDCYLSPPSKLKGRWQVVTGPGAAERSHAFPLKEKYNFTFITGDEILPKRPPSECKP